MADGQPTKSTKSASHTRSISLPNPLSLIPDLTDSVRHSLDDAFADQGGEGRGNFLDNLIAIGQAAVEAANLQDEQDEQNSDDESTTDTSPNPSSSSGDPQSDIKNSTEGQPSDGLSQEALSSSKMATEMSMSESDSNYSLLCPVCLENFYRPHVCHPCKHTFCEPCLCRLRKADINHPTKCPLCREKIKKCTFNSALSSTIVGRFPEVHQHRHKQEKKQKLKLPPLPGVPITVDRYGKNMLATWSAVCAVVLLMMFIFTVFTSFVGFVLWYTIEVVLDIVGELLIEASDFFSFSWQALIILWIEGKVPQEIKDILSGSMGRIGATMSRLVNRTKAFFTDGDLPPPQVPMYVTYEQHKFNDTSQLLTKMTQVNVANYVLLAGVFTYFLYRLARYFQNGNAAQQAEAARLQQ